MVARPGGRAGGWGSARHRAGQRPTGGPDGHHHRGSESSAARRSTRSTFLETCGRSTSEHVHALAGSIRLQGMLVPVVVRPAEDEVAQGGWKYELVAGFHRVAAAAELQLREIPVVIRESGTDAAAATENIARKQLNPQEEANAVKAMLDRGLTEDGAAQALGWPKVRITARVKILELPERAQEMIGAGRHRAKRGRPAAGDRTRLAAAAGRGRRVLGGWERVGGRAARARARLGAGLCAARREREGVRRLHEPRRAARDRRAAAREEDRGPVRRGREAAQADRPLCVRPATDPVQRR